MRVRSATVLPASSTMLNSSLPLKTTSVWFSTSTVILTGESAPYWEASSEGVIATALVANSDGMSIGTLIGFAGSKLLLKTRNACFSASRFSPSARSLNSMFNWILLPRLSTFDNTHTYSLVPSPLSMILVGAGSVLDRSTSARVTRCASTSIPPQITGNENIFPPPRSVHTNKRLPRRS